MSGVQALALAVTGALFALYTVTAGVDFGAGLLGFIALASGRREAAQVTEDVVSPVWEVTNVFLILFALALVSFFPGASALFGGVLLLPVATGLLLIVARYMAFGLREALPEAHLWLSAVYGLAGWLVPAPLMAFLVVSEGVGVSVAGGSVSLAGQRLLLDPLTWALVVAALTGELALAGSLLSHFASTRGAPDASRFFRRTALAGLWASAAAGAAAALLLGARGLLPPSAGAEAAAAVALLALGAATWPLARGNRPRDAFVALLAAYLAGLLAFGLTHLPYLFRPVLTVTGALNDPAMLAVLVPVFIGGLAASLPLIWWVYVRLPEGGRAGTP